MNLQANGESNGISPTRLDETALDRLRELDPDGQHGVLQRVLSTYEASLSRSLVQLRAEAQAGQAHEVARLAHMLKSASASVGALDLSRACAELEARLRDGQVDRLREDVDRIRGLGQQALQAVEAMLRP